MLKSEEKALQWVQEHLLLIVVLCLTLISVLIRSALKYQVTDDARYFLLIWYQEIKERGGLLGLNAQVGNYNMLYQICIAFMTYLPVDGLMAYKLLSVIFDYLLAIAVGTLVYEVSEEHQEEKGAAGYLLVVLSPIVFLNSSAWGQCDSIYTFFAVMSLLYLVRERYVMSMIFLGVAFSFKLQAIFLMPIFLLYYYRQRRFSILLFLIIPACMVVTALPCILQGRPLMHIFGIYAEQTELYAEMQLNYPSFWLLLEEDGVASYPYLKNVAIFITIAVLMLLMVDILYHNIEFHKNNVLRLAFLLTYTCVLFLPCMHERYGYMVEILAIPLLIHERKTWPLFAALYGVTLITYGSYLYGRSMNLPLLGIINTMVYAGYVVLLLRSMAGEAIEK